MYDHTLEAAQTLSDPRRTLRHGTLGRGDGNATTTDGLGRRGGVFGQGLVRLQERRGEKRGEEGVLLQASTRREPATSTARVSSTRVSKQTLHASPLEHLRGGKPPSKP